VSTYFDTSFLVALYVPNDHSAAALRHRLLAVSTAVTFRKLHTGQIRRYLGAIHPFDKAGGYAIQEEGDLIVKGICGSFTNVVGLPMERLREELEAWEMDSR